MSMITEPLPGTVEVCGSEYPVHTDFRHWLEISRLLFDVNGRTPAEDARILGLAYKVLPPDIKGAFEGIMSFVFPERLNKKKDKKDTHANNNKVRAYSFYYDEEYIYADFLRYYQIDLTAAELHWHTFLTLFYNLPSESNIKSIMDIRTKKLSEVKDKKARAEYRRLKEVYALPDIRTENEKETDFADMLW